MPENDFFKFAGTPGNIEKQLIEKVVLNRPQAGILFEAIKQNQNLLSDGESFKELHNDVSTNIEMLNFLTDDASYFINVKFLTLAFICLIFDITISRGFASFLLDVFGTNYAAIKLNDMEKCVAYKIRAEKRVGIEQLKALTQCNYTIKNKNCGHYNNDGTCGVWTGKDVQEAVNSLISQKTIYIKDNAYEIVL